MQGMGFYKKWVDWISYEFCFNGSAIGPVIPTRGLRQRDPLSPYLFLFCVEGLSSSLHKAATYGVIHGIQISPSAPVLTHLLFADDNFLFFHANVTETMVVKTLLNEYEKWSGQYANFQKSEVMYSDLGH